MKALPFQLLMIIALFTASIAYCETVQKSNQNHVQAEYHPYGGGMQMPLTGDEMYVLNEFVNGGHDGDFDLNKKDDNFSKPKKKVEYDASKILLS